ncbi:sodium:solute symporter family transporter [Calditrichota bacterium GD2]
MSGSQYTLVAVLIYAIGIGLLALLARRKGQSLESFAIGGRKDNPFFIGLSLAANMTSAATFVINPGLVYLYGFSGFLGYAVAAPAGIFLGLIVMSKKFRQMGEARNALTIPQWIGQRFNNEGMTRFFAVLSFLQITFIVLIAVGLTIVLSRVLQAPYPLILFFVLAFTLSYIVIGGASIHILTNSYQGIIMSVVAVLLIISGPLFGHLSLTEIFQTLKNIDPNLVRPTNPNSLLFRDLFEVFIANFLVGVAIICQPHILSKALYLRSDKDVNAYLLTVVVVGSLYFFVLFSGLYARVFLHGPLLPPDQSMAAYINQIFPPPVLALVTLGILAAGFSTLEGLFIALSTIFSIDLFKSFLQKRFAFNESVVEQKTLLGTRVFLIVLAVVVYFLSVWQIEHPSLSVAIFAQNGVYGLFVATFWPIFTGLFLPRIKAWVPFWAGALGLVVHFGMYYGKITHYHTNPGVCAAIALLVGGLFVLVFYRAGGKS